MMSRKLRKNNRGCIQQHRTKEYGQEDRHSHAVLDGGFAELDDGVEDQDEHADADPGEGMFDDLKLCKIADEGGDDGDDHHGRRDNA